MYGEPGGLQGEITLPQLLAEVGYATQAVGKWHLGENVESQPQNAGFDDFYGFLSVSDMYSEWRDPAFFPDIVYSEARTEVLREGMRGHLATFQAYPPKRVMGLRAQDRPRPSA